MSNEDRVAGRLGLEKGGDGYQLSRQSLLAGIGGWLGIAEAILPATVFSVSFAIWREALISVASAAALSVLFILVRLVRKQSAQQAIVGTLAVGLAAFLALRDGGSAADYFVPGFFTNAAYGTAMLLSILVRRPLMGYVAQLLFGLSNWRQSATYRRLRFVTWIWFGFFAARLAVQLPLYFTDQVELLAASRVVMGAPAYAGLLALSWILLRRIASESSGKLDTANPRSN